MTSLQERLCTWVQVNHLYQPTQNGPLNVYLRHHVAHCLHCQHEIEAIQILGTAVTKLDFSVPTAPDDASWARLSAALPQREFHPATDEIGLVTTPRPVNLRNVAYGAMACAFAGVAFGAIYFQTSRGEAPVGTPQVAVNTSPNVNVKAPAEKEDTALAFTREQAKQVVNLENTSSDPFAKSAAVSEQTVALPLAVAKRAVSEKSVGGQKPLIVASATPQAFNATVSDAAMEVSPPVSADQLPPTPRMALRTSAVPLQNVAPMDSAMTNHQGTTSASYMPSAAMELTESQNRLRSLLQ
jgi:hypothetical protein